MFASARPLHLESPLHHVLHARLDLGSLFLVVAVIHDALVEVTVANMAEDASKQAEIVHLLLADFDKFSESAEWNCHIGTP